MEETISLQEIAQTIRKRLAMILIITILATLASGIVTKFFMTPQYDASTQILVNQTNQQTNQLDMNQVQTNVQLINTYSVIIKSPTILNDVVKNLGIPVSAKAVTIDSAQNSQVFTVTVETASATQSVKVANEIAKVFQAKIQSIMKVDNVSVLSKATLEASKVPVKPNLKLNLAIAFVVGLMISIGLAFLLEYLDNTVKSEEDIQNHLGLPVLGAVVDMTSDRHSKRGQASRSTITRGRSGNLEA